eukprot:1949927-Pleurochrysis_carterae.AAC.1
MRRRGLRSSVGYKWTEEEEEAIEVEAVVGNTVLAHGLTAYANQFRVVAGVVLCCIVWQGYPLDMSLAADAAEYEASTRKDAELIDLEESKRLPAT